MRYQSNTTIKKVTIGPKVEYSGLKSEREFLSVDPLAGKMPGWSPYSYCLANPVKLVDPDGRFPIDPAFRKAYPLLTGFIEKQMQGYFQNSARISNVLSTYSVGALTHSQISNDFKSNQGPRIMGYDFVNPNQNGEYEYNTNSIRLSNTALSKFEKMLGNSKTSVYGKMEFSKLFINEYTHYGDALDGYDAIKDAGGNIVNDYSAPEPVWGDAKFDEGNEAADKAFPFEFGHQNYFYYKRGEIRDWKYVNKIYESNKSYIDESMIPEN